MKTFKDLLKELDACADAIKWAGDKNIEEVIKQCHRGDWLLWLAKKVDIGLHPLTLAKGHCANTVRHLMKDERSIKAVDTAIAFGEGREGIDELNICKYAAYDAAYDADAAAYAAAYASAAAGAYAAYTENRLKNEMETADICRQYVGDLIIVKVNELLNTNEK